MKRVHDEVDTDDSATEDEPQLVSVLMTVSQVGSCWYRPPVLSSGSTRDQCPLGDEDLEESISQSLGSPGAQKSYESDSVAHTRRNEDAKREASVTEEVMSRVRSSRSLSFA